MTVFLAIVGSGPTGCYTAQALRKALPDAEIVIFERDPQPYGLVRTGVAPDHTGTKAVTRQFDRLFERERVTLVPGVEIGRTVALDELTKAFHAVVIATGLGADRRLGIAGETLPGVTGSGAFARFANGAGGPRPDISGHILVIGAGNVAIDVARVALKGAGAFAGETSTTATIVARGTREAARFDPAMLKELEQAADGRLTLRFGLTPLRILGEQKVEAILFEDSAGKTEEIACDSIVTAIGFEAEATALPYRPFETGAPIMLAPGLFAAGWFRRGPRGTIVDARAEGQTVAAAILESGCLTTERPGYGGLSLQDMPKAKT